MIASVFEVFFVVEVVAKMGARWPGVESACNCIVFGFTIFDRHFFTCEIFVRSAVLITVASEWSKAPLLESPLFVTLTSVELSFALAEAAMVSGEVALLSSTGVIKSTTLEASKSLVVLVD